MALPQLIGILSKSSPEAVTTLTKKRLENKKIKDYLYVKNDIDKKFIQTLRENKHNRIIVFLCGSSGDGKSELIARHYKEFKEYYEFHIDATHSFRPEDNAIDTLNEKLLEVKEHGKSLVVGINMGVLGSFAKDGEESHSDIKKAINDYLENNQQNNAIQFINFEDFPKFNLSGSQIESSFIGSILSKITSSTPSTNPFYSAYIKDLESNNKGRIHLNFKMLSSPSIQKCIIKLLVITHLKFDQFLTSRNILDFIFALLDGPKLLIDNLFVNGG